MQKLIQWTSWCLLFVFPATMLAVNVENVAMLSASGTVRVNGAVSPQSSTVIAGDTVMTAKDSAVTLTSKGRTITLPENSSLTYNGKRVRFEYGRMLVSAQPGTEAQLGNLTISPARAGAKMTMQSSGKQLVLVAEAGSLNVTDGMHSLTLLTGQSLTTSGTEGPSRAPSGSGGGAPSPALTSGIPGWVFGLAGLAVGAGTMGGLAATGVFSSGSGRALSPTNP